MRDLRALPKAHLHVHLEGAMRPSTLAEFAARDGVPIPPVRGYTDFTAFSTCYVGACELLRSPDDLARVVREVVEDAAADGAVYVEPAFTAAMYRRSFAADEAAVEIVLDALAAASAATGVATGLLLAADRSLPPAEAQAHARLAARYAGSTAGIGSSAGVVAFGLHHDETLGRPEPFGAAFRIAKDAGLRSAPHAGELAGPDSVWGTLDALAPDRIQHGVRSVEDPRLLERLAAEQVCLDVCPTSNVMLGVVPSLDEHPLPALLAAGVRCSLNGDDPLLFGPGLLAEYETARDVLGLDERALAGIAATSLSAAALDTAARAAALAAVERWLTPEAA